jgi:hypothetical protein
VGRYSKQDRFQYFPASWIWIKFNFWTDPDLFNWKKPVSNLKTSWMTNLQNDQIRPDNQ